MAARRSPRLANSPAVPDEVEVEGVDCVAGRADQAVKPGMRRVGAKAGRDQPEAPANAQYMRVDRHRRQPEAEKEDTSGGLGPDARESQ